MINFRSRLYSRLPWIKNRIIGGEAGTMFQVRLDQLARHVLGNLQGLSHRAALGDQPLQIIAGCQEATLLQRLDL